MSQKVRAGSERVLIGLADALAAPETAWSLLDAGYRVSAFARKGQIPPVRWCRGVELVHIAPPEDDANSAVEDLRALAGSGRYRAVLPLDDRAIWLCDRAFRHSDVAVAGPTGDQATLALDKGLQIEQAEASGLDCLPTRVVNHVEELLRMDELPAVLKPLHATELHGTSLLRGRSFICADRNELESVARSWDALYPLVVQPFVEGRGEGIFGLVAQDRVTSWSAHCRIRMTNPAGSAASACMSRPVDSELMEPVQSLMKRAGWQGPFMVEFLRDKKGKRWFLELNGRLWGSLALSRRSQLEYPAWAIRVRLDDSFVPPSPVRPERVVCRHLGGELAHLAFVARGPSSAALEPTWPKMSSSLRSVVSVRLSEHWYNYRRHNPSVFVADTIQSLGKLVRAGLGQGRTGVLR